MSEVLRDERTVGRIVAVHEETLHVVTEQGIDFELLIPPDSALDRDQLRRFEESGENVAIHYQGSPGGHSGTVLGVEPAVIP